MSSRTLRGRARTPVWLFTGAIASVGAATVATIPAASASPSGPSAVFALGVLAVVGDVHADNTIVVSRDAAGNVLVNNGAVPIQGGHPTVANTRLISMIGGPGADVLTLDEVNGALPRATLIGGAGPDTLAGGSDADTLIGQAGNDTLLGKGGNDLLFGGADNDTLTGGDADDQVFGQAGDDRMIWNPGDDTDLNEGGDGTDVTEVNGGNGSEQFTATANGTRVRFDRVNPAPFSIDIGTTENLVLNANGGDDSFSATGNLAALIAITVDGGTGNDTLSGSNGADTLRGGDGNDTVDGQQGNDVAFLEAGDDTFQWDPGDGSDTVEGQDGVDTMLFNGNGANENFDVSPNGARVRFTRNVGNIVMDTSGVERIDLNAGDGTDNLVVNDMTGTDLTEIHTDLAAVAGGAGDGQPDSVVVNATNGNDVAVVAGQNGDLQVADLATAVSVTHADPGIDRLTVNTLDGDDVVDASGVAAGSMLLTLDGGRGDDVLVGGNGDDVLLGGEGDDVLLGGPGTDTLDGGPGDNILIQGENVTNGQVAGSEWLASHAHVADGTSVIEAHQKSYTVPAADLTAPASA
jgi:Ca2+-binding RTX toxin-like protein